jgi:hypothetical protein
MDHASMPVSEKELGGVSIHVELIVGGDDFESIVNDVLAEYGGSGLFIGVVEPTKSRVDAWHRAARCWGACFFAVLIF